MSLIQKFRLVAIAEGVSYLVLLFIAMPLKYMAGVPEAVLFVGWIHGILFILYMVLGLQVMLKYKWDFKTTFVAVIASLLPFGTFVLDKKILKRMSTD